MDAPKHSTTALAHKYGLERLLLFLLFLAGISAFTSCSWIRSYKAVGQYELWLPDDISISDNTAFVADKWLHILDVSDPQNITTIMKFEKDEMFASKIAVSGNTALVVDRRTGMHVIDIENPASPKYLNHFVLPPNPDGGEHNVVEILAFQNYVFLYENLQGPTSKFYVLDIADPNNISLKATYNNRGIPIIVTEPDNSLYTLRQSSHVARYQISPEGEIIFHSSSDYTVDSLKDMVVTEQYIVVLTLFEGLQIMNKDFNVIGKFELSGGESIAIDEDRDILYMLTLLDGLKVVDISNPIKPVLMAQSPKMDQGIKVTLYNDLVFVVDSCSTSTDRFVFRK